MSRIIADLEVQLQDTWNVLSELRERNSSSEHRWSAADQEAWDKAEKDFDETKEKLERERQYEERKLDLEAKRAGREAIERLPSSKKRELLENPASPVSIAESRNLALHAWACCQFRRQDALEDRHWEACKRLGVDPRMDSFTAALPSPKNWRAYSRALMAEERAVATSMDVATATEGAEWIAEDWVRTLERTMLYFGPMLQVADVRTTGAGGQLNWPKANDTGNTGRLLTENTDVTVTLAATSEMVLNAYKFSSDMVVTSAELIEDSIFDFASVIGEMLGERLGRVQNTYFTTGTGSSQPQGIVTGIAAGQTQASATADTLAAVDFISLVHKVDLAYRNSASGFMMNDLTVQAVRKLLDGNSNFLWQPGLQAGQPDRLLGYPVYVNNDIDGVINAGADNYLAVFGDFRAYKVRRVNTIRLHRLVERYRDSDQEGFVAFVRSDGDILQGSALARYNVT